jgi:hypothetical protein
LFSSFFVSSDAVSIDEDDIDRSDAAALGLSPPSSPGRGRQPVEFDQAINYVTRIKVHPRARLRFGRVAFRVYTSEKLLPEFVVEFSNFPIPTFQFGDGFRS